MQQHISTSLTRFSISSLDPPTSNRSSTTVNRMLCLLIAMRASCCSQGNRVAAGGKKQISGIILANSSSCSLSSFTQLYIYIQVGNIVSFFFDLNILSVFYIYILSLLLLAVDMLLYSIYMDLTSPGTVALLGTQSGRHGSQQLPGLQFPHLLGHKLCHIQ